MAASLDPLALVLVLGSAQCLFLAIVFARADRGNAKASRLLSLFFLVLPASTLDGLLYRTGLYRDWPFLIGIEPMARLLVGPVFYFYVESLVDPGFRIRKRLALHAAIAAALLAPCLPFFLEDPVYKMMFVDAWLRNAGYTPAEYFGRFWYELAIEAQVWAYLGLIWFELRRYERMIRESFSSIDSITLAWARKVVIAFALALAARGLSYVLFLFFIKYAHMYLFAPLAAAFVAYYISYKSFHQSEVFLLQRPPLPAAGPAKPKYQKSALSDEESELLLSRLEKAMRVKRPYADPELSLAKLAGLLSTSHHHLSQLLNQRLSTSFYDYVNGYRVEQVKAELAKPGRSEASILDIALDCGFNSKSAFNKIFKRATSMSPSQYRARTPVSSG
jgi:AraC-like DNA-binding protein